MLIHNICFSLSDLLNLKKKALPQMRMWRCKRNSSVPHWWELSRKNISKDHCLVAHRLTNCPCLFGTEGFPRMQSIQRQNADSPG